MAKYAVMSARPTSSRMRHFEIVLRAGRKGTGKVLWQRTFTKHTLGIWSRAAVESQAITWASENGYTIFTGGDE